MSKRCMRSRIEFASYFITLLFLCGVCGTARAMSNQVAQTQPSQPPPQMTIIFGTDNRTLVSDTTKSPWSAIGHVICDYGFEMALGTGALIGNKTVLTAGHVIYDQTYGTPLSITFIPAQNGSDEPYGTIGSRSSYVPNEWKQGSQDYDLGLIVLDTEIGKQTGFLQVAMEPDSFFSNQPLESAGYPADLGDGYEMYSVTGDSTGVQGVVMLHRITTEEGQSGSPIWFMSNNVPTVVGLNVGWEEITNPDGSVTDNGLATRFDEELGTFINNALSQNGDVIQKDLPAPSSSVPTTPSSNSPVGLCGIGAGQALVMLSLSWVLCFAGRSFRRAE